jgi:RNA polymerase sigma-70 factor (ECF subfamily)
MSGDPGDPLDEAVVALRAGDREAIGTLYLALAPALRGYLRRRVAHGEVADDLVEQAFLALLEAAPDLRGGGRAVRAWLYTTARRDLADWRRRADRRSDHPLPAGDVADPTTSDPAQLAEGRDPALEAALAALPPAQREVVELRFVADLPPTEVARLLGRSSGAVRVLQHRALRRLAVLLADTEASEHRDA